MRWVRIRWIEFDIHNHYMWWLWMIKIILFIIFIYVGHCSWEYIKNKISQPKTKDLVNIQTDKYRTIIKELTESLEKTKHSSEETLTSHNEISIPEIPMDDQLELQMDLEQIMTEYE